MALNLVSNTTTGSYIQTENGKIAPTNRRNYLINGNFDMWQRGTSFVGWQYTADRWVNYSEGGTTTAARYSSNNISIGSDYYININSVGGSANNGFLQIIEGLRRFSGKTITLSYKITTESGSRTNTAPSLVCRFGTGGSTSIIITTSSYNGVINGIATATFTVPDLSSYTFGTVGTDALQVTLPTVGTFSISLSQLKLENGAVATDGWHPYDGEFGGEVQACGRYLPVIKDNEGFSSTMIGAGYSFTTTSALIFVPFNETRVGCTGISISSLSDFNVGNGSGIQTVPTQISLVYSGRYGCLLSFVTTGLTAGQGCYARIATTSGRLLFTGCEL